MFSAQRKTASPSVCPNCNPGRGLRSNGNSRIRMEAERKAPEAIVSKPAPAKAQQPAEEKKPADATAQTIQESAARAAPGRASCGWSGWGQFR
jgi:hypothetical protein